MREPERLFESDPDLARIRALLDRDGLPDGALDRVAARVLAADSASAYAPVAASGSSSFKLWLLVGLGVLGVVATGSATLTQAPRNEQAAPSVSGAGSLSSSPAAIALAPEEPRSAPNEVNMLPGDQQQAVRVEDLPRAVPTTTAPSKAAAADPFLEELAIVERARAALANGRGRECLEAVRAYEKRFAKGGVFAEEVDVMRIEALAISGERAQARARGERFLALHGETPYVERVRRVLDQTVE